jgi:hypothetical protein
MSKVDAAMNRRQGGVRRFTDVRAACSLDKVTGAHSASPGLTLVLRLVALRSYHQAGHLNLKRRRQERKMLRVRFIL